MFFAYVSLVLMLSQASSSIAGRIEDESGRPLAHVAVIATPQPSEDASRGRTATIRQTGFGPGTMTNEEGEFRIERLQPGAYVVRAVPDPAFNADVASGPALVTTYYPGTINLAVSQVVMVSEGQRVNLVFPLMRVPTYALRGKVVDEAGSAVADAVVRLIARNGPRIGAAALGRIARTDADGLFTLKSVATGTYSILAVPPKPVSVRAQSLVIQESGAVSGSGVRVTGPDRQQVRVEWRSNGDATEFNDADGAETPVAVIDRDVSDLFITIPSIR